MTELEFLSVDRAVAGNGFRPVASSPLERALRQAPLRIRDISGVPKTEVRGEVETLDVDAEVVPITPQRALVLGGAEVRESLRAQGYLVFDMTAALAGLEIEGETLMRRLTDLDLDDLPAAGAVARVPAIVLRDGDAFRIFFPEEYGHYLAEVVVDAVEGLP